MKPWPDINKYFANILDLPNYLRLIHEPFCLNMRIALVTVKMVNCCDTLNNSENLTNICAIIIMAGKAVV